MLQLTVQRVTDIVPFHRIFVSTAAEYVHLVKQQLPELPFENIIVEPDARDTAPAIGYASVFIRKKVPGATVVLLASDQHISPVTQFQESIQEAAFIARQGKYLVSVGIAPTYGHTGYGYMQCGATAPFSEKAFYGLAYIEKPDQKTADEFVAARQYLWNTNIFSWTVDNILDAFNTYQPQEYQVLQEIERRMDTLSINELETLYNQLTKISIDYSVLEKIQPEDSLQHIFLRAQMEWSDVGSYEELSKMLQQDDAQNRIKGAITTSETTRCLLMTEAPYELITEGITDLTVVVNSNGDILVMPANSKKKIKEIIQAKETRFAANPASQKQPVLFDCENIIVQINENKTVLMTDVKDLWIRESNHKIYVHSFKQPDIPAILQKSRHYVINNINIRIVKDYILLSNLAVDALVNEITQAIAKYQKAVIVLSAGGTPEGVYQLLINNYKHRLDWSKVVLFQMDEYLGLSDNHPLSYAFFLKKKIIEPLGIREYYLLNNDNTSYLENYEQAIRKANGIDVILHGIGHNGHIGFNEPGSAFDSKTRVVALSDSTIEANSRFFDCRSQVPVKGITLGLDIISQAKKTILIASGKGKKQAVKSAVQDSMNEAIPASILQGCSNVTYVLDEETWVDN
ncbi:glucosamine-6-phosphate deaminase [Filimonas lacunae]|nr:glucosamine-6-phosphate deaminase [Filimonas lacunae]